MIDVVPWEEFLAAFDWRQGEHVTLVGPTGSGKTTLGLRLLACRDYSVVIATKPRDETLSQFARDNGYEVEANWPPRRPPALEPRVVFWPDAKGIYARHGQAHAIASAFDKMYRQGRWCVFIDEAFYLTNDLGLGDELQTLWTQGRSLGLSIVAGMQRPRHVPLHAYSQASHLFFWRSRDAADVKRLSEIGGSVDPKQLAAEIMRLPRYAALYVDAVEGTMLQTRVSL